MGRKILMAVDDSIHSEQVVKYAARMCSAANDITYTLFNVQPVVPLIFIESAEANPQTKAVVDELVRRNVDTGKYLAKKFKDLMVREGIQENRIETISTLMQHGLAKDILDHAEHGSYDAIVLARRGLTPSRDFFIGTVAAKVVEHALKIPVWVVAGETVSMKVMLAVDGSENSFRDVDHLIDMVGANPDLRLTLFHVLPYLRHYYSVDFETKNPSLQELLHREDKQRMESFCKKVFLRFETAGLKKSQVEIKTSTRSHDISTAILGEAKTVKYDTVVIGRRGEREAFFTGRIAMRLVGKVSDQTLWVVP